MGNLHSVPCCQQKLAGSDQVQAGPEKTQTCAIGSFPQEWVENVTGSERAPLAEKLELTTVLLRASLQLTQNLFKQVCAKVGPEDLQRLREFRDVWLENGSADLPEA